MAAKSKRLCGDSSKTGDSPIRIEKIFIPTDNSYETDEDDHKEQDYHELLGRYGSIAIHQLGIDNAFIHLEMLYAKLITMKSPSVYAYTNGWISSHRVALYQGTVLTVRDGLVQDQLVCIKKIRHLFHTANDAKRVLTELRVLQSLKCNKIPLDLYDIIPPQQPKTFDDIIIILEYFPCSLINVFQTNQFFTTQHIQHILHQLLSAIQHLHSMSIVHRDLQPKNIRIDENCKIKIDGFGKVYQFDVNNDKSIVYEEVAQLSTKEIDHDVNNADENQNNRNRSDRKRRTLLRKPKKKKKLIFPSMLLKFVHKSENDTPFSIDDVYV